MRYSSRTLTLTVVLNFLTLSAHAEDPLLNVPSTEGKVIVIEEFIPYQPSKKSQECYLEDDPIATDELLIDDLKYLGDQGLVPKDLSGFGPSWYQAKALLVKKAKNKALDIIDTVAEAVAKEMGEAPDPYLIFPLWVPPKELILSEKQKCVKKTALLKGLKKNKDYEEISNGAILIMRVETQEISIPKMENFVQALALIEKALATKNILEVLDALVKIFGQEKVYAYLGIQQA